MRITLIISICIRIRWWQVWIPGAWRRASGPSDDKAVQGTDVEHDDDEVSFPSLLARPRRVLQQWSLHTVACIQR